MNETIYIHDDAHDAFMTRPWHTTRSIGQHSYSCRSVHAIGGQARCRHGLAPALFICAVTGASLGACRPGGEAAHRGGWYELLERGYLLVFEALQIPTNEGSPRIQQSKMMLSQR
jgi:hypothetical protein